MNCLRVLVLLVSFTVSLLADAATVDMQPGSWELRMHNELPIATAPTTTIICVTTAAVDKIAPPKSKKSDDCKVVGGGVSGSVLSYETKCAGRNAKSKTTVTYSGDRYESVVETDVEGVKGRQVITGRRLGACDVNSEESEQ